MRLLAKASSANPTACATHPAVISVRSFTRAVRLPTNGASAPIASSSTPNGSEAAARERSSSFCKAGIAGPKALMTTVSPRL